MFEHDNYPECIILHHSFSSDDNETMDWIQVYKWHVMEQGWSYIGYHWGIEDVNGNCMILPGRPEYYHGAHTSEDGMNYKSIGICLIGNFDAAAPSDNMLNQLYKLIRDIYKRYNKQLPIRMHREFAGYKSCPGKQFPINDVRDKCQEIWEELQNSYTRIDYREAIDEWSKRKLANGEQIISYPVQWQAKLLSSLVDSDSVRWLLKKTYKYIKENGL